jgi:hypothetical protein
LTSIGIVGAGRTRHGLGPVLARCAERAGLRVAGVAGRSLERAQAHASALDATLGHALVAHASVEALCASAIDALVIASPPEHHLVALQAAAAADLPVLCEKPLVHETQVASALAIIARLAERAVPIMENCQWAYVVPAIVELAPSAAPRSIALGLEPPRAGREMIRNSLSHLLSAVQALMPFDATTSIRDVRLEPAVLDGRPVVLRFAIDGARRIDAALHVALRQGEAASPWIAFDGERLARRVGPAFDVVFTGSRGSVTVREPIQALVDAFAMLVRGRDRARTAAEIAQVRERLRLYRDVVAAIAEPSGRSVAPCE